jgi:serine/threonine protein kinase
MRRSCPQCFSEYVSDVDYCGLDGAKLVFTEIDPLIGKTIDRYELLERLGHGGMSVVYRARHTVIGHEYALKVPYGEYALDRQFAERLRREAQAIARLDHPNIVRVFDFFTTPAGSSFILMELLRGRSLSRAILDDGPMKPKEAVRLLRQIAGGLEAAHDVGFIHRDLKPGNVMLLGEKGAELAKILDFGLVRIPDNAADETAQAQLTEAGMCVGTPCYMPPEQMRGETPTPQSDIYALGAAMFEMLSGRPPYRGSLADILVQQATHGPAVLPPCLGLESLVSWMLEREPSRRPRSIEEVSIALDYLGIDKPIAPPRRKRIRRRKLPVATLAFLGIATFGIVKLAQEEISIRSASSKLQEVDRSLVNGMAEVSEDLEQKRSKSCSVKALDDRVSGLMRRIDRAEKSVPKKQLAQLEKRTKALSEALSAKGITGDRCRTLARSVSQMEREVYAAVRPKKT